MVVAGVIATLCQVAAGVNTAARDVANAQRMQRGMRCCVCVCAVARTRVCADALARMCWRVCVDARVQQTAQKIKNLSIAPTSPVSSSGRLQMSTRRLQSPVSKKKGLGYLSYPAPSRWISCALTLNFIGLEVVCHSGKGGVNWAR